jgi:hypothetical protein
MSNWLALARADFSETGAWGTDKTARTPVSSVLTVPQPATSGDSVPEDQAPLEPRAAARRRRVLAFLDANPNVHRAVRTDVNAEPGKVVVTIGLRGVGTGEVEIPAESYDAGVLMTLLDTHAGGAAGHNELSKESINGRSSTS